MVANHLHMAMEASEHQCSGGCVQMSWSQLELKNRISCWMSFFGWRRFDFVCDSGDVSSPKIEKKSGHGGGMRVSFNKKKHNNRNTENKELQFQNMPQGFTSTASSKDGYNHRETVIVPTSLISGQAVFLPTSKVDMSPGIQLRSEPEMPLQYMVPGVVYHYHTNTPEKITFRKSIIPSSSPLHKRMSFESPTSRRENNAQTIGTTVHPLPLPPGATRLPPSSPPQIRNRSDVVAETPKQSRWKKGKLIGRGTFGSIYVGSGSNRETKALCAMKEFEWCRAPASDIERSQLQQMVAVLDSVVISESVDRWT